MTKKFLDLSELEPEDNDQNFNELSEAEMSANVPLFDSVKLADIIITNRYIGLYKNLSIESMEELSRRRLFGDNFEYETYIEENLKKLPKLDFTFPEISSILDKLKVFKK